MWSLTKNRSEIDKVHLFLQLCTYKKAFLKETRLLGRLLNIKMDISYQLEP